jgi:dihydrofolate reductase
MPLSLIVAMSENRVIGRDGDLPWRLSADLKRFKKITMGHHLIMGRKTWDSIGRPLPGRTSVVISRTATIDHEMVRMARSLEEAIEISRDDPEPFVTGGGDVFRMALPFVDRLYLTLVHTEIEGDVYFPEMQLSKWKNVDETSHPADEKNEFDYTFRTLERIDG